MQDLQQLKQAKDRCIADLSDALPRYKERLDSVDPRLVVYIEDALSNHASHARSASGRLLPQGRKNLYVLSPQGAKKNTTFTISTNYGDKRKGALLL